MTLAQVHALGFRQWGLPTIMFPGATWATVRSDTLDARGGPYTELQAAQAGDARYTVSCIVARGDTVRVVTLPVEVVEHEAATELPPDDWREAVAGYVRRWTESASPTAWMWADLPRAERLALVASRVPRLWASEQRDLREAEEDGWSDEERADADIGWGSRQLCRMVGIPHVEGVERAWLEVRRRWFVTPDVVLDRAGPFPCTLG